MMSMTGNVRWIRIWACSVLLVLLGSGACFTSAQAAIAPQYLCTSAPDPNAGGTPSGSKCVPVTIGEWRYTVKDMQYNFMTYYKPHYVNSEDELLQEIQTFVLTQQSGWCAADFVSVADGASPELLYQWGILVQKKRVPLYRVTGYKWSTPPCGTGPWDYKPSIYMKRTVSCPKGFTGVYDSATGTGPYCACPWGTSAACPVQPCFKGSVSKGNPCNVTTGYKTEEQVDYEGPGDAPLRIVRTFNSKLAYENYRYSDGFMPNLPKIPRRMPVGTGWMATYLQYVQYTDTPGFSGLIAYRADGSELPFMETGGAFVYSGDTDLRVEKVLDGGGNQTGWRIVTGESATELYDMLGRLTSITFKGGQVHTIQYWVYNGFSGPSGTTYIYNIVDSFGHELQFHWDDLGRIQWIALPDGGTLTYAYEAATYNLTSVTYPDGTTRTYQYEYPGDYRANELTGITDEAGVRYATWTYSVTTGQVTKSEHAGSVDQYLFSYPTDTTRTVTDPTGTVRTYTVKKVQGHPRISASPSNCGGCSEPKAQKYDFQGNIISRTDFNNQLTCYAYDTSRNLETVRVEGFASTVTACPGNLSTYVPTAGTQQRKITTSWHSTYRLPTQVVEPNRTTAFTYDGAGNLRTRTITDTNATPNVSRTWTYTYNSAGMVLTADGPRTDVADVTTYAYYNCTTGYQCGQLQSITNALNQVTTYNSYNAHGQPLTITDPNGVVTTLTYDARQRVTSRQVGSEVTSYSYWPTGLLKRVTLSDGSYTEYTYDLAHRLSRVADAAGNYVQYTLDNMGNRIAERVYDPSAVLHRTHTRVYNSLNFLYQDLNAAGTPAVTTTYGYDTAGNQTSIAAPLSRNTSMLFDELHRLKQISDPGSGVTQFTYDANDNLAAVSDPRTLATSYAYNGFGDLLTQTSPDTGQTISTYDSGGNLATSTDARGAVSAFTYDVLNRVTSAVYRVGSTADQTITFTYDTGTNGVGRLRSAADANHSTTWTYDALGRVTGKGQTIGTLTRSIGYAYTNGNLVGIVTPSGQAVGFGYDTNHRVSSISVNGTTVLAGVTYEPLAGPSGWTWGNGTGASRAYDADGRITQIASGGVTNTYGFDDASRITSIADVNVPANSWTFGYDSRDRLTNASSTGVSQGFTYDANGNRLTQTGTAPWTLTISPTSNRLTATSGTQVRSYSYDAAGNPAAYGGITFDYNNRNRLRSFTVGSVTSNYLYNALGQRIHRNDGASGSVVYMYDEAGHLIGEYDGAGALIQETVWLGDIPVATIRPNGGTVAIYYVHADHLGTPRTVTRPSDNAIMWRWASDPFGAAGPNENPQGQGAFVYNLRLPGQVYESRTGLNYNYFRDYDPQVGRYVESDPIGLLGGLNTYSYVDGNPVSAIDAMGLCWSNARAIGHFYGGGGQAVSVQQIGCSSQIDSRVQPQRNIWKTRVENAARTKATSMRCGTSTTLSITRSVGLSSGVFWIGGFSLLQDASCGIRTRCPSNGGAACTPGMYWFDCSLSSRMHDLFVNPSDFDNSANSAKPDFWDRWNYGGKPFYVNGTWADAVSGQGNLP